MVTLRLVRSRLLLAVAGIGVSLTLSDLSSALAGNPINYGRYGGPAHSGPGRPVDAQDRVYRRHDLRYNGKGPVGIRASRADGQLIEESAVTIVNPFNRVGVRGRIHGAGAIGVFAAKPSLYEMRLFGKNVPIPSTGLTSVGIHNLERGFNKIGKPAVREALKGGKKAVRGAGRALKKISPF